MRLSFRRVLFLIAWLALVIASLRPAPALESALDALLAPTRVLAELAAPLGWLRSGAARAAERDLREREASDREQRAALFREEQRHALPREPALEQGRRFVRAEVIGRDPQALDSVRVRLESDSSEGIELGAPVICGDAFVGRIDRLIREAPGEAWVRLVTARGFFVGARLVERVDDGSEPREVRLIAGGVCGELASRDRPKLAVHHAAVFGLFGGDARVDEGGDPLDPIARLADGFALGRLEYSISGAPCIVPVLDYRSGLFQLAVVCRSDVARAPERAAEDVLASDRWIESRVLVARDPSRGRAGLVLDRGASDGSRVGAAVVAGMHLVGEVASTTRWTSDVALLADPGHRVSAVARIDGVEQPMVLGMLASRGFDGEHGGLRLAWESPTPIAVDGESVEALLFTASGSGLVPRGLLIGATRLPTRATRACEILVEGAIDGGALARVFVLALEPRP